MGKYLIEYDRASGRVLGYSDGNQTLSMLYTHIPHRLNDVDCIYIDELPLNYKDYKIVSKEMVAMSNMEVQEIKQYGRFLTEEERLLNKLKPSYDEIKKAESTIEILSLLQEVM